jgi:hypothetical protein
MNECCMCKGQEELSGRSQQEEKTEGASFYGIPNVKLRGSNFSSGNNCCGKTFT